MNWVDKLSALIIDVIDEREKKKTKPLDTVGTVDRIEGDTAWVKLAGANEETPIKQTITAKKGDKVNVRIANKRGWIVGNETAPPTDDTLAKKALENSDKAGKTAKRASDMTIVNDTLYYLASDQEEGVTVEDEGWTKEPQEVSESLPYLWAYHDYERGNGTHFKSDPVIIAMYAEDGVGVVSVETYYYVSTSQYQLIGGSWGTTYNYVSGTYIWRKELITHDDGTTTWTTALYDSGLTKSLELAYDTAQYIWTQPAASATTNVPSGQYVTEVDKDSYRASPTGGALLLRSAGLYLRYAAQNLVELVQAGLKIYEPNDSTNPAAQFLSSGAIVGKENSPNVRVDSSGMHYYNSSSEKGKIIGTSDGMSLQCTGGTSWMDLGNHMVEINGGYYAAITISGTSVRIEDVTDTYPCPLYVTGDITAYGSLTAKNIAHGSVSITPTANTPTSKTVSFGKTLPSTPNVIISAETSVPGTTVLECGATNISTTGFTAWVYRTNTTATVLHWIAIS